MAFEGYWWFVIGAALGLVQQIVLWLKYPARMIADFQMHPIQGLVAAAGFGAAVYGTILWLVFD